MKQKMLLKNSDSKKFMLKYSPKNNNHNNNNNGLWGVLRNEKKTKIQKHKQNLCLYFSRSMEVQFSERGSPARIRIKAIIIEEVLCCNDEQREKSR